METSPETLICPTCRRPPEAWPVDAQSLVCTNTGCGRAFSFLEEVVPIIVPGELEEVHQHDVFPDLDAKGLLQRVAELELGSDAWQKVVMAGVYAHSHYGDMEQPFEPLCDQLLPADESIRFALDLACGVGRMTIELARRTGAKVFGLDANPLPLRWAAKAAKGEPFDIPLLATAKRFTKTTVQPPKIGRPGEVRWVCGDVFHPPFAAEAFDLVTAVNLIDTVADPYIALGQACALVRRGGHLILAQPDTWDPNITPPKNWLADDEEGWRQMLARFGFRTVRRVDELPWELRRHPRQSFRYSLHGCLAKKER